MKDDAKPRPVADSTTRNNPLRNLYHFARSLFTRSERESETGIQNFHTNGSEEAEE